VGGGGGGGGVRESLTHRTREEEERRRQTVGVHALLYNREVSLRREILNKIPISR